MAKTKDTTKPPSTTTAEVVDLSKEEVSIVTLHFKNLKFDFKYFAWIMVFLECCFSVISAVH